MLASRGVVTVRSARPVPCGASGTHGSIVGQISVARLLLTTGIRRLVVGGLRRAGEALARAEVIESPVLNEAGAARGSTARRLAVARAVVANSAEKRAQKQGDEARSARRRPPSAWWPALGRRVDLLGGTYPLGADGLGTIGPGGQAAAGRSRVAITAPPTVSVRSPCFAGPACAGPGAASSTVTEPPARAARLRMARLRDTRKYEAARNSLVLRIGLE